MGSHVTISIFSNSAKRYYIICHARRKCSVAFSCVTHALKTIVVCERGNQHISFLSILNHIKDYKAREYKENLIIHVHQNGPSRWFMLNSGFCFRYFNVFSRFDEASKGHRAW